MERLSDERLREITKLPGTAGQMASELLDLRVAVHELRQNIGIIGAELADKGAKLAAYKLLTEENEKLRARCTWLQERRAVLRKLLAAKWSKRKEVRALRAKLAAGPVMPAVPSESIIKKAAAIRISIGGVVGHEMPLGKWIAAALYEAIRTALLEE